jgi:hypothetical protein
MMREQLGAAEDTSQQRDEYEPFHRNLKIPV